MIRLYAGRPSIEAHFLAGAKAFLFSETSRPALRSTQPPF